MATQQFGYGPGVWTPAKGVGAVAFPKLQQPGAVAPKFKPENKYKALAAKAIGEMAYGAMMNQQAKKEEAIAKQQQELSNFISKSALDNERKMETEAYGGPRGSDWSFMPSIADGVVPTTEKDVTSTYNSELETEYQRGEINKQGAFPVTGVTNYDWDNDPDKILTTRYGPMSNEEFRNSIDYTQGRPIGGKGWVWIPDKNIVGWNMAYDGHWTYQGPSTRTKPARIIGGNS